MSSYRPRNLGNDLLGAPAIALGFYLSKRFAFSQDERAFVKDAQRVFRRRLLRPTRDDDRHRPRRTCTCKWPRDF